ncbi:MAG: SPOR domain-containing protein [Alloprevotella sp.]|nr:SPOR domain-containing protein [Alloprevotella sp.]MBR1652004.1 SPOR domain-containing protein [Alloprevotella sp.]
MVEHNCVIVPRLGGFVTQYVAARYEEDEQLFLPPYRSVAFNPQLTLNDGLLVQSYMRVHSTTYPQTVRLIEKAVDEMKRHIQTDGSVELHGIGRLSMDMDGRYDFEPLAAGVTAPKLFGLSSYSLLQANRKERPARKVADDKHYHLSINRELANYVAAAIVGVLFYLAWALPEHRDAQELTVAASVIAPQKVQNETAGAEKQAITAEKQDAVPETQDAVAEKQLTANSQPTAKEQQAATAEQLAAPAGTYTLVLATGVALKGAETLVAQLQREGFNSAEIVPYHKSKKVVYGTFSTESEARAFAGALRSNPHFREAWVSRR